MVSGCYRTAAVSPTETVKETPGRFRDELSIYIYIYMYRERDIYTIRSKVEGDPTRISRSASRLRRVRAALKETPSTTRPDEDRALSFGLDASKRKTGNATAEPNDCAA